MMDSSIVSVIFLAQISEYHIFVLQKRFHFQALFTQWNDIQNGIRREFQNTVQDSFLSEVEAIFFFSSMLGLKLFCYKKSYVFLKYLKFDVTFRKGTKRSSNGNNWSNWTWMPGFEQFNFNHWGVWHKRQIWYKNNFWSGRQKSY